MSSFWTVSNGQQATGEVADNNFDPLAKGDYPGMLEAAELKTWEGVQTVSLKFSPSVAPHEKRKLFLTLKCWDTDSKKRDRAINVLMKLFQVTKAAMPSGEPTDADLAKLCNKPVTLKLDVWETEDKAKSGNWLVNASEAGAAVVKKSAPARAAAAPAADSDFEENIPF